MTSPSRSAGPRPVRRRCAALALTLFTITGLLVPATLAAASPATPDGRAAVPGGAPAWAADAQAAGMPASTTKIDIQVALQPKDAAGARATAAAVSDPSSSSYGHYLSPARYRAAYAPSAAAVRRVSTYLTDEGLSVSGVAPGNLWVSATGSVAQLNRAFATTVRNYRVDGVTRRAAATAVSVPSGLRSDVTAVAGLTQTPATPMSVSPEQDQLAGPSTVAPPTATQCSQYWGQYKQTVPSATPGGKNRKLNTYLCGYTGNQLQKIYGVDKTVSRGNDGHGVTVAIVDAYANPTMLADANHYFSLHGQQPFAAGQYQQTTDEPFTDADVCGGTESSWYTEEALDIEAVHGVAPGATVHYYGAKNCDTGLPDTVNDIVQTRSADIISNSYLNGGDQNATAADVALYTSITTQAVAEGIGIYFCSGDLGDNVAAGLAPQATFPASLPYVTAVGGTSEILNRNDKLIETTGWETTLDNIDFSGARAGYQAPLPGPFLFGAGGGSSTQFAQPYYQKSAVPASLANRNGTLMRVSPDIAADADPYTGMLTGYTRDDGRYEETHQGGTSLATPIIAAVQAIAEQNRSFPIGFANPLLYSMPASAFNDVVPTAPLSFTNPAGTWVASYYAGSTQATAYGYDDITGRGTPKAGAFIDAERN